MPWQAVVVFEWRTTPMSFGWSMPARNILLPTVSMMAAIPRVG